MFSVNLSLVFTSSLCFSPNLQSITTLKSFIHSAKVFIDLSLDLSGCFFACVVVGRLSPPSLFSVSFGSIGLTMVKELNLLCLVMELSDFSLAISSLFIACDTGFPYPHFPFSFSLVPLCLVVEEDYCSGYEMECMGISCATGDLSCSFLQFVAVSTTSACGGLAYVGDDVKAIVITLLQGSEGGDDSIAVDYFTFSSSIAEHLRAASLVISHAGSGSIFETLRLGKPLIVVVNEDLMDNHQSELAEELETGSICTMLAHRHFSTLLQI